MKLIKNKAMSIIDVLDMNNPFPAYEKLRKERPVFFDDISKYWIITRYNDVKQILLDENSFSAELERMNYKELSNEAISILDPINFVEIYGLSSTENPTHDKVKRVLMPIFNKLFEEVIKPIVSEIVDQEIEKIRGAKRFDIIEKVFYNLPAEIIFRILGIPRTEVENVKQWSESRMFLTWGDSSEQAYHARNIVKYWHYCVELVNRKKQNPGNDLPSYLLSVHLENKYLISIEEITLLCYGLVFSGHTTTTVFLAESLKLLLESKKWEELSLGIIPISQTCNEMLRLCPSAFTRRRLSLKEVVIAGVTIPKNEKILLAIGSANRDKEIFKRPNRIDFERKNSNQHLSFGRGFHYCIGAKLVHLEYEIVLSKLITLFPNLKLSSKNDFVYQRNLSIRSMNSLFVENN